MALTINSKLQRLLTEEEIEKLRVAIIADKVIIAALTKLINKTCSELQAPTSLSDFEKSSWALEKAYCEGGLYYLQQLLTTFKE